MRCDTSAAGEPLVFSSKIDLGKSMLTSHCVEYSRGAGDPATEVNKGQIKFHLLTAATASRKSLAKLGVQFLNNPWGKTNRIFFFKMSINQLVLKTLLLLILILYECTERFLL